MASPLCRQVAVHELERFPIVLNRHREERSDVAIQPLRSGRGLLRFARNDGKRAGLIGTRSNNRA
jgi:hypothetical protein